MKRVKTDYVFLYDIAFVGYSNPIASTPKTSSGLDDFTREQ